MNLAIEIIILFSCISIYLVFILWIVWINLENSFKLLFTNIILYNLIFQQLFVESVLIMQLSLF